MDRERGKFNEKSTKSGENKGIMTQKGLKLKQTQRLITAALTQLACY